MPEVSLKGRSGCIVEKDMPTDRWLLRLSDRYTGVFLYFWIYLKFSIIKNKTSQTCKIIKWENNGECNMKKKSCASLTFKCKPNFESASRLEYVVKTSGNALWFVLKDTDESI